MATAPTLKQGRLGLAIPFATPWRGDVYVYDSGVTSIPDGPRSPPVRAQIEGALRDISTLAQRGTYRSAVERGSFELPAVGPAHWTCRELTIVDREGVSLDSTVCLTGFRGAFVKLRLSGQGGSSRQLAGRLLTAWLTAQAEGRRAGTEL